MNNKNITLINPLVWENFFKKNKFKSVAEMRNAYDSFVSENKNEIYEINEMIENGEYEAINEKYGYDFNSEIELIDEALLGKRKQVSSVSAEDGFAEDDTEDETPKRTIRSIDDMEREAAKNAPVTTVDTKRPEVSEVDLKVVRNVGEKSRSINDIHYIVQMIYNKLVKNGDNYDVVTPLSLLDTEAVVEMDALFAFMDLPNMDISTFDTSNVKNMEGMFYKSTFNNDSIKNWDVSRVRNMRNTFIGSSMTSPEYINNWYPNTTNHALPKLGINISDELDADNVINKLFGDKESINTKYKERMSYSTESWHVMSSSEFIAEGKFGDYLKSKAEKIKSAVGLISIKLKSGMDYIFDKTGNMMNAITPKSMLEYIKFNNVNGVSTAEQWTGDNGYYEKINKGDIEYDNYIEFLKMIGSGNVNESADTYTRVKLSSNLSKSDGAMSPNINAEDWDSKQLCDYIEKMVFLRQKHPGREQRTLVVWGAPGIGKSSIPKAIIKKMNKERGNDTEDKKMSIIVADCSQMSSDGFALPTPAKQADVEKLIASNAEASRIAKENGISLNEIQAIEYKVSSDAPKTWLPVYKPTGDRKKDEILNALANGYRNPIYDEDNNIIGYEKTGSGGILLIDEFLRADRNVFFIVCQLMLNGTFNDYVLGDKWQIIAASNRPSDDYEVRRKFADAAAAGFNRLGACNFVPSFSEWKLWAQKHGFDETTLSFIAGKPFDGNDSRWHNFSPELKNSDNNPRFPSPRSWADTISELKDECEFRNYDSFGKIPKQKFYTLVAAHLPERLAQEYTDYYFMNSEDANPYTYDNILKNPDMKVTEKSKYKCANIAENVVTTVQLRYNGKNRIPVKDFEKIMKFFCNNYPANSDVIYTELYMKIVNICKIAAPENATDEEIAIENSYDSVGDIFANAFPVFVEHLQQE